MRITYREQHPRNHITKASHSPPQHITTNSIHQRGTRSNTNRNNHYLPSVIRHRRVVVIVVIAHTTHRPHNIHRHSQHHNNSVIVTPTSQPHNSHRTSQTAHTPTQPHHARISQPATSTLQPTAFTSDASAATHTATITTTYGLCHSPSSRRRHRRHRPHNTHRHTQRHNNIVIVTATSHTAAIAHHHKQHTRHHITRASHHP